MNIEHLAIWVQDIELMRHFYTETFNCEVSDLYVNEKKKFQSYFLSFESGARLEIMSRADISKKSDLEQMGYAHFALAVGSEEKVNQWASKISTFGIQILDGPRWTGDGYYEFTIDDPEGNKIEITI